MRSSTASIVRAISETLTNQVLPDLDPSTWTASNVRACAMLLLHVEDRILEEVNVYRASNALMRQFLREMVEERDPAILNPDQIAQVGLLVRPSDNPDAPELERLMFENETCKEAMTVFIHAAAAARASGGRSDFQTRPKLHAVLAAVHQLDGTLTARANRAYTTLGHR